jgi:hypothetical protein
MRRPDGGFDVARPFRGSGCGRTFVVKGPGKIALIESILSKMTPRKVHVTSLVAVLCGMFLLTAFLAWTTHKTHLDAVDQAEAQMTDFAAEAAEEWQQGLEQGVLSAVRASFQNLFYSDEMVGTAPVEGVIEKLYYAEDCFCIDPADVRGAFWIAISRGEFQTHGEVPTDTGFIAWLRTEILDNSNSLFEDVAANITTYGQGENRRYVAWATRFSPTTGRPAVAIAILTTTAALDETLRETA